MTDSTSRDGERPNVQGQDDSRGADVAVEKAVKRRLRIIAALVCALILSVSYVGVQWAIADKVPAHTTVLGADISHLASAQAQERIDSAAASSLSRSLSRSSSGRETMTRLSTSLASRDGCFELAVALEELVCVRTGIVVDTVCRYSLLLLDLSAGSLAM